MAVTLNDNYMRPRAPRGFAGHGGESDAVTRRAWRRDAPGPLVIRVERYAFERTEAPNGKPFDRAVGVYGETTVSKEKVYLRLSSDEEERQDGGRGVSRMRRPINAIRMGAGEQTVRGRFGELKYPEKLSGDERFLFRCDRVVPIRERGRETSTPDGYTRMRTSWITPVCNYRDKAGNLVDMLGHVETDAWSTVNVGFSGLRDDGAPNYYETFLGAVRDAVDGGSRGLGRVARQAAAAVVDVWRERQAVAPGEAFGRLSITTWKPDTAIRVDDAGDGEAVDRARKALTDYFADPKFAQSEGLDSAGEPVVLFAPATPDVIVRLLNARGEVCGFMRVNEYLFDRAARSARAGGDPGTAEELASPEGRAQWLVTCTERMVPDGDTAVGFDILTGECHPVSRNLTHPGAFGSQAEVGAAIAHEVRNLIRLGIEHCHTVCSVPRETVGASTLFMTRNMRDVVNGVTETKDCEGPRNAVLLAPGGAELAPGANMDAAVREERAAFSDLAAARARELESQERERAARLRERGQEQAAGHEFPVRPGAPSGELSARRDDPAPRAADDEVMAPADS